MFFQATGHLRDQIVSFPQPFAFLSDLFPLGA